MFCPTIARGPMNAATSSRTSLNRGAPATSSFEIPVSANRAKTIDATPVATNDANIVSTGWV